jgi:hypothetical protein
MSSAGRTASLWRGFHRVKILNLRELYHELGEYDFRVVLPTNVVTDVVVKAVDADGRSLGVSVIRRWGRKLMCSIEIDERVPDGVSIVMAEATIGGQRVFVSQKFWVVK